MKVTTAVSKYHFFGLAKAGFFFIQKSLYYVCLWPWSISRSTYRFLTYQSRRKKTDLFVVVLLSFIKRKTWRPTTHTKKRAFEKAPKRPEEKAIEPCRTNYCRAATPSCGSTAEVCVLESTLMHKINLGRESWTFPCSNRSKCSRIADGVVYPAPNLFYDGWVEVMQGDGKSNFAAAVRIRELRSKLQKSVFILYSHESHFTL